MTKPDLGDRVAQREKPISELLRRRGPRRLIYAFAALIFALLSIFPRVYVARVKLLSQDENAGGLTAVLGAVGGGLQNFASLIGSHQTTEVYLMIGRSNNVARDVVNRLHLIGPHGYSDMDHAEIALARKVDIHTLNGGVLEVEAKDHNPDNALKLVTAFDVAIQNRVAQLSRQQTAEKKAVVSDRLAASISGLAQAQARLDQFRRTNNMAEPPAQFGAALGQRVGLQAQLQAKKLALQTALQFETAQSIDVKSLQSQISALEGQIARDDANSPTSKVDSLDNLAVKSTEYLDLYRQELYEENLYQIYDHALEQVSVQELVADANNNVETIENPFLDPRRQLNLNWVGALLIVLLLAFYTEYYVPVTGLGYRRGAEPRTRSLIQS